MLMSNSTGISCGPSLIVCFMRGAISSTVVAYKECPKLVTYEAAKHFTRLWHSPIMSLILTQVYEDGMLLRCELLQKFFVRSVIVRRFGAGHLLPQQILLWKKLPDFSTMLTRNAWEREKKREKRRKRALHALSTTPQFDSFSSVWSHLTCRWMSVQSLQEHKVNISNDWRKTVTSIPIHTHPKLTFTNITNPKTNYRDKTWFLV